jgi:hypothetical protein
MEASSNSFKVLEIKQLLSFEQIVNFIVTCVRISNFIYHIFIYYNFIFSATVLN